MAPQCRARLERGGGRFLLVRIVAGSAHRVVRLGLRIEIGEALPHLVAAEALFFSRDEKRARCVERGLLGDRGGELVAERAVKLRLVAHSGEPDLGSRVTFRLAARRVGRRELVHGDAMACHALHVAERGRIGLEVNPVAGRRRDALPDTVGLLLNVALRAHLGGHLRVRPNFFRAVEHPEIHLTRTGSDRLLRGSRDS